MMMILTYSLCQGSIGEPGRTGTDSMTITPEIAASPAHGLPDVDEAPRLLRELVEDHRPVHLFGCARGAGEDGGGEDGGGAWVPGSVA